MNNKLFWIVSFVVVVYFLFLTYYNLWYQSMRIDEWFSSVWALLLEFNPKYIPQYLWFFFWENDFFARMFSPIFSLVTVLVLFFWSISFFKFEKVKYYYLWAAFILLLFCFSEWIIIRSRQARFYSLLMTIFVVSLYFLWNYYFWNNKKYYFFACLTILFWLIFHQFVRSLLVLLLIFPLYKYIFENKKLKDFKLEIVTFVSILIVRLLINYLFILQWSWWIPSPNDIWSLSTLYMKFYQTHLLSELWVIYIAFRTVLIYRIFKWQYKNVLFRWLIFIINVYVISSKWILLHTRYMLHLFPIIIMVWWFWIVYLVNYIFSYIEKIRNDETKNLHKYWLYFIVLILFYSLLNSFNFSITPKQNYFIDFTSPQPNFKQAYSFFSKQGLTWSVVSGFPHMCERYTDLNSEMHSDINCDMAIRVNLSWHPSRVSILESIQTEKYTWAKYINSFTWLNLENSYFVLDDLTLKSNISPSIVRTVLERCYMIYSDKKIYNDYNFIGIWTCDDKRLKDLKNTEE